MSIVKTLTTEIKTHFRGKLISNVKRAATGTNGNIWRAVKRAKNLVHEVIPNNLTLGGVAVAPCNVANSFAGYFQSKVKRLAEASNLNVNVYNGKNKLIVQNRNFMTKKDVLECVNSLPNKKCEGYDRIPVCVPDQWKISKIVPTFILMTLLI